MSRTEKDKIRYEQMKADPVKWEAFKAKQREYHNKHREKRKARARELYAAKSEEEKEKKRAQVRAQNRKVMKTDKYRFDYYKRGAKRRDLLFEITELEFVTFISQSCVYCGEPESKGIDRIDSDKGYVKDNITPCCSACNYMKKDYQLDYFIQHCKKIAKHNS